jgi:hypothetical protein
MAPEAPWPTATWQGLVEFVVDGLIACSAPGSTSEVGLCVYSLDDAVARALVSRASAEDPQGGALDCGASEDSDLVLRADSCAGPVAVTGTPRRGSTRDRRRDGPGR